MDKVTTSPVDACTGQVLVEYWSSTGGVLVEYWSSTGRVLVEYWSSTGRYMSITMYKYAWLYFTTCAVPVFVILHSRN